MDALWRSILGGAEEQAETLPFRGRTIAVPRAGGGAARFPFADLCSRPLGAADFLALAAHYHTLMVDGVPVMGMSERNEAKRFILLVDTLYDAHRRIVVSAEAPADELYRAAGGTEAFEFDRTVSRLIEMRSDAYLHDAGRLRAEANGAAAAEIS